MHAPPDANEPAGIAWIDRLNDRTGRAVSWLTLIMVIVTFTVVVSRYVFAAGWIWVQESIVWMHAATFLLASAWALRRGDHVRVDVFYRRLAPRAQARIDLAGSLLLLLPFCGYVFDEAWPYVAQSFAIRETSREAAGLPAVWLLKSLILMATLQIALQGLSEFARAWRRGRHG